MIEPRKKQAPGSTAGGNKSAYVSTAASVSGTGRKPATSTHLIVEEELECDLCRTNLYVSMLRTETVDEEAFYCLQHGLMYLKNGELQAKESKLIYNLELDIMSGLLRKLTDKIAALQQQQQQRKANSAAGK